MATSAIETAKQENGSRVFFEYVIEKNQEPPDSVMKKIYDGYNFEWKETYRKQASALKSFLGSKKGYEYSRDDGIMPFLEKIAINKCGVSTKDSWNPADIYIVRKTKKREIETELTRIGNLSVPKPQKLDMLNDYMRKMFVTRDLVGISLKKLGRTATVEETNVTRQQTLKDISVVANSVKLDLDLASNGEFNTGEMKLQLKVGNDTVNVQIRAFSGGVRESTQMDMTGAGAAAKLGKVSAREAIDPFLNSLSPAQSRRMGSSLPKVGAFTEADIKTYVDEQEKLKDVTIGGSKIDFGSNNWETTLRNAIELEKENNRTASQLSAKIQCFQWVKIFQEVEKQGKLKEFLSILYFGAKKQYATAGPFLKIS